MCVNVEVDLSDETVATLETLALNLLATNDVNYDTVKASFDVNFDGTIEGLEIAIGKAVTDVFITDITQMVDYIDDMFDRWNVDCCSRSYITDEIETKAQLVHASGAALINHILVKAVETFIQEDK